MNLSLGIVGLPNVGKSTLFNALTKQNIPAENFPFCTINPNIGVVAVNDPRVDKLAEIEKSKNLVRSVVQFTDIAGLVKGASKGEGLGNQFLSHIREVNAILHVIRRFKDDNVTHVDKSIDPARDIETIETELIIKDTETLDKRISAISSKMKNDTELVEEYEILIKMQKHLNSGKLLSTLELPEDEKTKNLRKNLSLLTDKPILYLINEAQEKLTPNIKEEISKEYNIPAEKLIILDVKLEAELSELTDEEQKELLSELGLSERPLDVLIKSCQRILGLIDFFTSGEDETRAWTIYKGDSIVEAAGTIHTDFADNFIAADVIAYDDFIKYNGWKGSKDAGKIRLEGKGYIVKDGDVVIIRHGAG